ncbi:hypothetical protein NSMS1_60910 (plasmid) [Nostoc sp. MS1]|nr:hypothetical protein NSMS1_60910 [Nostoc sp. MS1]
MPPAADKRYDDAAIEPDNPGHVSNECRVTMLGISRWTGSGGSYRTMLRFFHTVIPWATLFWLFFHKHLFRPNEIYLLAGDEVVISKSGKQTYGLDRFFSSLAGKPISGLSFLHYH